MRKTADLVAYFASGLGGARVSSVCMAILTATALCAARPAAAEFEISFYSGVQAVNSGRVTGNDPTGAGPFSFDANWDARSLNIPVYYGFRGTYWRDEKWGFLVEFNHSKAYATDETLNATGFQALSVSHGLNSLVVGVSRRWLNQWGRFTPRVALAVGTNYPHIEVQTAPNAAFTNEYQAGGLAVVWMGGVSYDLTDKWRLLAEYRGAYHSIDASLNGGGSLKTDFQTNALNLGISYAF